MVAQVDALEVADTTAVVDKFIKEFISSKFDAEVERRLIPVLKMDNFDMDVSMIDPPTLHIMVNCRYFEFSAERYTKLATISLDLSKDFIIKNQAEFMSEKDSIAMSCSLFESLINSERIQKKYKDELFSEYAENYMTEGVAMKMAALKLPVTKDIVDVAMNCVEQKEQAEILFANCGIYDADDFPRKFCELGGEYADLADRTRRHSVRLSATPEHYLQ